MPNAQPPLPSDWIVQPTHPVVHVPYHLAKCWDDIVASKLAQESEATRRANKKADQNIGRVPREMREASKRNPITKVWTRDIEEPVRWFLTNRHAQASVANSIASSIIDLAGYVTTRSSSLAGVPSTPGLDGDRSSVGDVELIGPGHEIRQVDYTTDNSDGEDTLVLHDRVRARTRGRATVAGSEPFRLNQRNSVLALQREEDWEELLPVSAGSHGTSNRRSSISFELCDASSWRIVPSRSGDKGEGGSGPAAMLFTPDEEHGSSYKRWIVHSIAAYYGLDSTSVDDGESRRRCVFVGPKSGQKKDAKAFPVPQPMWDQL